MKPQTKSWLMYSTIRVVLFAGVFTLLMLLSIEWWLSAVLAALISACVSYIFFNKRREEVARNLYELRHGESLNEPREDDEVEDAAVEASLESERHIQSE